MPCIQSITSNIVPLVDSPRLAAGFQPGVGTCLTTDPEQGISTSGQGVSTGVERILGISVKDASQRILLSQQKV